MTALTEREFLEPLRKLVKRLGRDPEISDVGTHNGTPSITSYRTRFGSLRNALKIMRGRSDLVPVHHTREELIRKLQQKAEAVAWRLSLSDITSDPTMPLLYEYVVIFGGVNAAFIAAICRHQFRLRRRCCEIFVARRGGSDIRRRRRISAKARCYIAPRHMSNISGVLTRRRKRPG